MLQSAHNEWLLLMSDAGYGGKAAQVRPLIKGRPYGFTFNLSQDPDFGDWTDGSFVMQAKIAPGTSNPVAATFACTTGTPVGLLTPVNVSLDVSNQTNIPEIGHELVYELSFVPTGGGRNIVFAGIVPLAEGVIQ